MEDGTCNFVGESGIAAPLLTIAARCPRTPSPTGLPMAAGLTCCHSQTVATGTETDPLGDDTRSVTPRTTTWSHKSLAFYAHPTGGGGGI